MALQDSLFEMERRFWNADDEFYSRHLSEGAVMVFPEPTGILGRAEVIDSLGGGDRWSDIEFDGERLVELGEDAVQLVYRAVATRTDDRSEYSVLVTSSYIRKDGSWLIKSHQQTPIERE